MSAFLINVRLPFFLVTKPVCLNKVQKLSKLDLDCLIMIYSFTLFGWALCGTLDIRTFPCRCRMIQRIKISILTRQVIIAIANKIAHFCNKPFHHPMLGYIQTSTCTEKINYTPLHFL